MTSPQLAVLLAVILVIAFVTGAYIYTTMSSAPQWAQPIIVKSVCIYPNGTMSAYVSMIGSGCVHVVRVDIGGMSVPVDVALCAGQQGYIRAELPSVIQTLVEGRLVMADGRATPFVANIC